MNLAETYRPKMLDEMTGQEHLIGPDGMLRKMLEQKELTSCIFYGPPGTGKTTAAWVLAKQAGYTFFRYNAVTTTTKNIQSLIEKAKREQATVLLCLDEIQYFNKRQQQTLLSAIETGELLLIATTTENPYFSCIDALLSRCVVMEFQPVTPQDIRRRLTVIAEKEKRNIIDTALTYISENAGGDVRRAIQILQLAFLTFPKDHAITITDIEHQQPSVRTSRFDSNDDIHYNLIAALQKSIRGSDPNAAVFYLARLLEAGDILSPCRRLMVIANEDIGFGNPDAIPFVYACVEMAKQLGIPEAAKPLTNAVLYLAISPKSSTCESTYDAALEDVRAGRGAVVPKHINKGCPKGYKYPHDYPNHWVNQQYLPDDLACRQYYTPGDNAFEQNLCAYWSHIMHQ